MITIYTIAYNEEIILPYFIKWYKKRFPDCRIVIYDNESTDNTVKIALENNCEIISYSTNNQLSDSTYLKIKNNCWKTANTNWVLVCNSDEFLDISIEDLKKEKSTIIRSKGFNMYNLTKDETVENTTYGVRARQYDKFYLFNKKFINEINYEAGCHSAKPKGKIIYSEKSYLLLHFSYIGENYIIERYKRNVNRLSDENIKNGWGIHYKETEKIIKDKFKVAKDYYAQNNPNFNEEEIIIWNK